MLNIRSTSTPERIDRMRLIAPGVINTIFPLPVDPNGFNTGLAGSQSFGGFQSPIDAGSMQFDTGASVAVPTLF
jgi:hypothetical protein